MSAFNELAGILTFKAMEVPVVSRAQRRSDFSAPFRDTVALLTRELKMLGARQVVMEVAMSPNNIRRDGMPRADARAYSPAVRVGFVAGRLPGKPALSYDLDTFSTWQDNVRALALGLEALRKVDRYGLSRNAAQYAGYKALESGSVGDGNPERGRELIAQAGGDVRRALHAAHPDHGGEPSDFRDIIAARDQATAAA